MKDQEYNKLLEEVASKRYNWADLASEKYINDFKSDQKVELNLKNELTVAILGSTQVGKTTLILNLLGIKSDYINEISKALRGKRTAGNSATIAVTRYKSVRGDNYSIIYPGSNKKVILKNEDELENEIFNLRHKVENNIYTSHDVLTIGIPESKINKKTNINIIDLPGTESRETKEKNYVRKANEFWIFNAHAKIIAVNGTDLTFLRDMKNLEGMGSIDLESDDTITLITKACSPKSIIDRFNDNHFREANDLRTYYYNQIKSINDIPDISLEKIFISDFYPPEQLINKELFNKLSNDALKVLLDYLLMQSENITSYSQLKKYYSFLKQNYESTLSNLKNDKRINENNDAKIKKSLDMLIERTSTAINEYFEVRDEINKITKSYMNISKNSFIGYDKSLQILDMEKNVSEDILDSVKKRRDIYQKYLKNSLVNKVVIKNGFYNEIVRLDLEDTVLASEMKEIIEETISKTNNLTRNNINRYNSTIKNLKRYISMATDQNLELKEIEFRSINIDTSINFGFFGSIFGNKDTMYKFDMEYNYNSEIIYINNEINDIVFKNLSIFSEWLKEYNYEFIDLINSNLVLINRNIKKYETVIENRTFIDKEILNITERNDSDKSHSVKCKEYFYEEGMLQVQKYYDEMVKSSNHYQIVVNLILLDLLVKKDFEQIIESVNIY
ncbi:hypothetical protein [Macrococcus capreoli]|uniref:hypothetical protein n=1 Tax=Macrococcus capreoli TaxID=2982690 RepID=UPI003EE5B7B2